MEEHFAPSQQPATHDTKGPLFSRPNEPGKGTWWRDASCCVCPVELNKHARKVENTGPFNIRTCFGVNITDEKVWLCSGCRRNFGRHKKSLGARTYLIKPVSEPLQFGVPRRSPEPPSALDIMVALAETRPAASTSMAPASTSPQISPRSRLHAAANARQKSLATQQQQHARARALSDKRRLDTNTGSRGDSKMPQAQEQSFAGNKAAISSLASLLNLTSAFGPPSPPLLRPIQPDLPSPKLNSPRSLNVSTNSSFGKFVPPAPGAAAVARHRSQQSRSLPEAPPAAVAALLKLVPALPLIASLPLSPRDVHLLAAVLFHHTDCPAHLALEYFAALNKAACFGSPPSAASAPARSPSPRPSASPFPPLAAPASSSSSSSASSSSFTDSAAAAISKASSSPQPMDCSALDSINNSSAAVSPGPASSAPAAVAALPPLQVATSPSASASSDNLVSQLLAKKQQLEQQLHQQQRQSPPAGAFNNGFLRPLPSSNSLSNFRSLPSSNSLGSLSMLAQA